ncbi:MAG TPA: copper chaperone PCu(A)C [Gallionella sp.]|nr:copper chaperone PCu(A)C [Gallionella sp.]
MSILFRIGGLLAALLISAGVFAGDIQVENAWARATAPGQDTASVDLTITSKQDAQLAGASSPACASIELHSMMMAHDSGMMKMRGVPGIALPAGKPVNLGESGFHLMLTGLKAPLRPGERVPLTLEIQVSNHTVKIEASADVRPLTAAKPMTDEMQQSGY